MTSNQYLNVDLSENLGDNSLMTQNVLLVRLVSFSNIHLNSCSKDAQRPENTTSFIHRYPFDSLWRNGSASAFLQEGRSSSLTATLRENSSAQYRLPSFRSHSLPSLRHHGRLETNQQSRDPSIQRNLSFVVRSSSVPGQPTLRRFLKQLPPKAIRQLVALHDQLRARLSGLPKTRFSLIFDLDSVVLTIYGKTLKLKWKFYERKGLLSSCFS